MNKVTIYHNPRCSKSRQTLALLQQRGLEPHIVEYLKTPPNETEIARILEMLGIEPNELIRKREYQVLNLPETSDATELIRRMAAHPEIVERPIVVCGEQAKIGRPPEQVLEIL